MQNPVYTHTHILRQVLLKTMVHFLFIFFNCKFQVFLLSIMCRDPGGKAIVSYLLPKRFRQNKTKCWKCSNRQLQNKTLRIIKTKKKSVKSNYVTPDDNQKYSRKPLTGRCGTISLPPGSQHKKNNEKTWKITIKNDKQSSIVLNKNLHSVVWFCSVRFYHMSTILDCLMPNPFLYI